MDLSELAGIPNSEKQSLSVEPLDISLALEQNERDMNNSERAEKIWDAGGAFSYMYKACERLHVGDQRIIKIMLLSFAATKVMNSYGMHVTVSGDAGTGKSHVVDTVKCFLPPDKVKSGRMSDKALFHHPFDSGCVIILDDQSPTDDMQELVKESTTNFHKDTIYYSVKNGNPVTLIIKSETVFWMVKVEIVGDEQIQDRMFNLHTDNSTEQLEAIQKSIVESAKNPKLIAEDLTEQEISHLIWNLMPKAYVAIPWADYVGNEERPAARNLNLFYDLVRASALFHAAVRPRGDNIGEYPQIIATYHDFQIAAQLMNPLMSNIGGSQKNGTDATQQMILDYLETHYQGWTSNDPIPAKIIRASLNISGAMMNYALSGRNGKNTEGLCNICPGVDVTDMMIPNNNTHGSHKETGIIWDYNAYMYWKGKNGYFIIKEADIKPVFASYAIEGDEIYSDGSGRYDHNCSFEPDEILSLKNDLSVELERIENAKKTNGDHK